MNALQRFVQRRWDAAEANLARELRLVNIQSYPDEAIGVARRRFDRWNAVNRFLIERTR